MDFRPPVYCDVYKHLLVEELYYLPTPADLHYGLCSVIGQIKFENHRYLLQNIKLSCFDKAHSLPSGAISVLIIPRHDKRLPTINQYVEVFGEAVLADREAVGNGPSADTQLPLNAAFLRQELSELQVQLERDQELPERPPTGTQDNMMNAAHKFALERRINEMKNKLEPAIYLDSFKVINEADEVILCNLELRAIQKKKRLPQSSARN